MWSSRSARSTLSRSGGVTSRGFITAVVDWLRNNVAGLPEGLSEHVLNLPEHIVISIDVDEFDGAGWVFASRRKPPDSLDASLLRSITRKLPKLVAEAATAYVLLLEKYALSSSRYTIGKSVRRAAAGMPDLSRVEVWIADTNGWYAAQTMSFYRVCGPASTRPLRILRC